MTTWSFISARIRYDACVADGVVRSLPRKYIFSFTSFAWEYLAYLRCVVPYAERWKQPFHHLGASVIVPHGTHILFNGVRIDFSQTTVQQLGFSGVETKSLARTPALALLTFCFELNLFLTFTCCRLCINLSATPKVVNSWQRSGDHVG